MAEDTQSRHVGRRELVRICGLCARYGRWYAPAYWAAVRRAMRGCREHEFAVEEAFRLGLFGPGAQVSWTRYVSKKRWMDLQWRLNPRSWRPLTADKGLFYQYCQRAGVRIPQLYGVFRRGRPGWSRGDGEPRTEADWVRFFETEAECQFVIKPTESSHSRDVRFFERLATEFLEAAGQRYTAAGLFALMDTAELDSGFVIQQRLWNHPSLVEFSGSVGLQTVRMITLVENGGACLLHAHWKPIVGGYLIDTYFEGMLGNVEAPVNLDDGTLHPGNREMGDGEGIRYYDRHPETGRPFAGFRLPWWQEACEAVKRAAMEFLPVRTLGWDVALTEDGPVIVEANHLYDPPNQHGVVPRLRARLEQAAGQ